MRTFLCGIALALLAGCGGAREDAACCAIAPAARCVSDLLKAGLTPEQVAIVTGPSDAICPSPILPEATLRGAVAAWPDACRTTNGASPLAGLDSGRCAGGAAISMDGLAPPPGVDPKVATACAGGLRARGVKENELWLVMREPDGACPNNGVDEARIREIITKDWNAAGCTQFTQQQMLHALNSGACGGDAG